MIPQLAPTRMTRARLLPAFAVASLVVAAVLAGGFAASISATVSRMATTAGLLHGRGVTVRLEEGRCVAYITTLHPTAIASPRPGWHAGWRVRPPRLRLTMRAVWEFDAHTLAVGLPTSTFILAAPIWCLAAPCAIAPLLWLRARRRRRLVRPEGFAVAVVNPVVRV